MENKKDIQNNRLTVVKYYGILHNKSHILFNDSLHWFQFTIIQLQASSET